jgi:hypothetical protein
MKSATCLFLVLVLSSYAEPKKYPIEVTAEQLLTHPDQYSGMNVIVSGYWARGFEESILDTDANLIHRSNIWVQTWKESDADPAISEKAYVEIVRRAQMDAHLDEYPSSAFLWIKCEGLFETNKNAGKQTQVMEFGHLGGYSSRLILSRIIEIKALPVPESLRRK